MAEGYIIQPVAALEDVIKKVEAERAGMDALKARVYAGPDTYRRLYSDVLTYLKHADMLSLEDAAARTGMSASAYRDKAKGGEALLIEIEGKSFVPAWSIKDGAPDTLALDIAREFVRESREFFRFAELVRFMRSEKAEIAQTLDKNKIRSFFIMGGLSEYECSLSVKASMSQILQGRDKSPRLLSFLFKHLETALTQQNWGGPPTGGFSRAFMDKYGIPGRTHEEAYEAEMKKSKASAPQPPKP